MHTGYFSAWPPRVPTSPGSNVLIDSFGDMHQPRSTPPSAASTPVSQHPPTSHTNANTTTNTQQQQQQQQPYPQQSNGHNHYQQQRQPLSAPSSPRLGGPLTPTLPRSSTSTPTTTSFSSSSSSTADTSPTATTTTSAAATAAKTTTPTTTAIITPAPTPTFTSSIPSSTSPPSSSSPSSTSAANTTLTIPTNTSSKTTAPSSASSSPFIRKPRPLSTSFLNSDAFSFRKNSSTSTSTMSSFSSGFPLASPTSSTPPVAYLPHPVTSSSSSSNMVPPPLPPRRDGGVASPTAAAYLSDSGSSSRVQMAIQQHYFDPRPNYGPISSHSNNSSTSTASTMTSSTTTNDNSNKNKKKKQGKTRSIYHQMGMGSFTQTPRSLPYADFLVPQMNRLGPSATAPPQASSSTPSGAAALDQTQEWSMSGASGPFPPPSSPSGFPSFQLRKSQSVGKSTNPAAKKGIKSRFKKLRQKRDALAFITSGESDSEAGNDNELETTTFNTRGMTSRFATGMSDTSNNNSGHTKTKSRQVAAIFDAGLPQHPFRNIAYSYSSNTNGSNSRGKGAAAAAATAGGENGGTGEGQQHKEPSAARFKDLFKNVGSGLGHHHSHSQSVSSTRSPVIHPASSPSPSLDLHYSSGGTGAGGPGGGGGTPMAGLMKPFQSRGGTLRLGDFLSGDDQPSTTPRFRIPAPGRRKKKFSKKVNSTTGYAPATDDEDSPAPTRSATTMFSGSGGGRQRHHTHHDDVTPRRQHNHHTHKFLPTLPQLHYRLRSRSFDEGSRQDVEITWRLPPPTSAASEAGVPNISPALRDARKANKDPGVLLVELEPLPTKVVHDLAAIKSHHHHHRSPQSQQSGFQSQTSSASAGPLNAFLTPSSTTASGFGSLSSAPAMITTNSQNPSYSYNQQMMMTPLLQLQIQEQQQQQQQHQYQQTTRHIRSKANPAATFCSKSFLFKSYHNSKFRGHYVFRVVGDQLEYRRLPGALEESCAKYFLKADFTYRSLEGKAKAIRKERDEYKRGGSGTSRSQSQPQLLHQEEQQPQQQQDSLPSSPKLSWTLSQGLGNNYGSANSVATLSSFLKEGGGVSQGDSNRFLGGGGGSSARASTDKRRNSGDDILKSAVAWDYYNPSTSAASTPMPTEVLSDSSISTSTGLGGGRPSRPSRRGGSSSYLNQRYNPENSNNNVVRTFLAGPGSDRVLLKSDPLVEMSPYAAAAGIVSFQSPMVTAVMARPPMSRNRKRSWTSVKEEQRREEEEDEARFKEMERKFREELEQAVFGLELYLTEILRGLEYERFDAVADVRVVNDNRDTAIFSLYNGDRTNIMSLESPSSKLKYEFLNRISMSLMGHEEAEIDALSVAKPKENQQHNINSFLNMSTGTLYDRSADTEDADLLYEIIEIRLRQQEARLRTMREGIQTAMDEVDSCLSQLDHLDERAKKMMLAMITAIDSQEVQLSLRPSPSTGWTLAATVDAKLKDVNERIVICTRIMGAARQNLNRLKYEIELEQRSIRLFRQYKIIIAVISGSIVFLVWFLYHARASALAPQPASPLFSSPPNPFEEINNFHHGEPPILPSPASTLGFTSSRIVMSATSTSTPVPIARASSSASSTNEKDHENDN
ncbi:hypothetical protein BGZ95_009973, partial [Linnemannia exigua]